MFSGNKMAAINVGFGANATFGMQRRAFDLTPIEGGIFNIETSEPGSWDQFAFNNTAIINSFTLNFVSPFPNAQVFQFLSNGAGFNNLIITSNPSCGFIRQSGSPVVGSFTLTNFTQFGGLLLFFYGMMSSNTFNVIGA